MCRIFNHTTALYINRKVNKTDRDEVKREPLTPPNVESATETGMIHDITPNNFCPNVWERDKRQMDTHASSQKRIEKSVSQTAVIKELY